jgi:hypothetical protein
LGEFEEDRIALGMGSASSDHPPPPTAALKEHTFLAEPLIVSVFRPLVLAPHSVKRSML